MDHNIIHSDRHVTILGNGIIGLATAYALKNRGFEVTVIDRASVDEGTSTGNAGAIAVAEMIPIAEPGYGSAFRKCYSILWAHFP